LEGLNVTARRPQAVLFACSHNALRSPMAKALAQHLFGREVYFASVGVRAGSLDEFAIAVMDEVGLDISEHKPMSFEDLEDSSFDLIVTLSPEAHHKALEMTRTFSVDVVYWPTPDPSVGSGSREQIMSAYRSVRDGLMRRIKTTFDWRPIGEV
jgi:protein-tyrosine-phosphatase